MAARLEWKERSAMIQRGKRIIEAHWRNRTLDLEARIGIDGVLDVWFERHIHRYCATVWGMNIKPQNKQLMQKRFWQDVIKELEATW